MPDAERPTESLPPSLRRRSSPEHTATGNRITEEDMLLVHRVCNPGGMTDIERAIRADERAQVAAELDRANATLQRVRDLRDEWSRKTLDGCDGFALSRNELTGALGDIPDQAPKETP